MIEDIEEVDEEGEGEKDQTDMDRRLTAMEWDDFLERVGIALQEQSPTTRECTVSSKDLDGLMQHIETVLHGKESGHELDEFMAHINCHLHGHVNSNTEIDCMLHQVRRNINRHQRSKRLSVFHSQQVERASIPLVDIDNKQEVSKVEVGCPDDEIDAGSETGNSSVLEPSSKVAFLAKNCTTAMRKSSSAPDLHTVSESKPNSVGKYKHKQRIASSSLCDDDIGDVRVMTRLTRLSVAFGLGMAIGMIILKYGV